MVADGDGWLPPFQAGQYVNLFVDVGGIRTSRPYSIASTPYLPPTGRGNLGEAQPKSEANTAEE